MPARPASGREPLPSFPASWLAAADGDHVPSVRVDPDQSLGRIPSPVALINDQSFDSSIPNVARVYDCLLGGCFF
jgi:hypothetical protein